MILKFNEFSQNIDLIEEEMSRVDSGRHLIYHYTRYLSDILKTDLLKSRVPSRQSTDRNEGKSISFTRNPDYDDVWSSIRLVFDTDYLKRYGIRVFPVDEWAYSKPYTSSEERRKKLARSSINAIKSNFPMVKAGKRGTAHGIEGLSKLKDVTLQTEFEERVYQDIPNLGKYIMFIDIGGNENINNFKEVISEYLKKYPHIKVRSFDPIKKYLTKNITEEFTKVESPKSSELTKDDIDLYYKK